MTRRRAILAAVVVVVLSVAAGVYAFRQTMLPNFRVVHRGILWRSGQPNAIGLWIAWLAGVKTIVCLRAPDDLGVAAEAAFARQHGIEFACIPLRFTGEGMAETVRRFLEVVADESRRPVLVHCARGKERSGVCSAVFRMEVDGWTNAQALQEMYTLGLKRDTLPVFEQFVGGYQPRRQSRSAAPARPTPEAVVEPVPSARPAPATP